MRPRPPLLRWVLRAQACGWVAGLRVGQLPGWLRAITQSTWGQMPPQALGQLVDHVFTQLLQSRLNLSLTRPTVPACLVPMRGRCVRLGSAA